MREDFLDDQWTAFKKLYSDIKEDLIPEDFSRAYYCWRVMDHAQRQAALDGIRDRLMAGMWTESYYVMRPDKYLQGEWKRKIISKKAPVRNLEGLESL